MGCASASSAPLASQPANEESVAAVLQQAKLAPEGSERPAPSSCASRSAEDAASPASDFDSEDMAPWQLALRICPSSIAIDEQTQIGDMLYLSLLRAAEAAQAGMHVLTKDGSGRKVLRRRDLARKAGRLQEEGRGTQRWKSGPSSTGEALILSEDTCKGKSEKAELSTEYASTVFVSDASLGSLGQSYAEIGAFDSI